jgi:hypothetical protein
MRIIITTNLGIVKEKSRMIVRHPGLDCHYAFRAARGSAEAQVLENKAFSRAEAAGPGCLTPNMG